MLPEPPTGLVDWSRIIAGLGSVLLSALLVVLYKKQKEQLAAQHEAVLEVTDVEWYDDKAIIWVSNFGNGVAKDLFLTTLVSADNGEHRNYSIRHNALKRIGTGGEWGNHIRSDEEEIPFVGKSKVGQPAPMHYPADWVSLNFSTFIRNAKENGANQVKYLHLVEGTEGSNQRSIASVRDMTRSVNPQKFDYQHSLQNLPGHTQHGLDTTFKRYFLDSTPRKWMFEIYTHGIRALDRLVPRIKLRSRPYDASGTKRVKRVLLKRQLKRIPGSVKRKLGTVANRVSSFIRENWKII
jgi:hypothetical protein